MKALALTAALALTGVSAVAQQQCGPRDRMAEALAESHGESVHVMGINNAGLLMELFGNLETGSWTALMTGPEGISCVATFGEGFEAVTPVLEPTGLRL